MHAPDVIAIEALEGARVAFAGALDEGDVELDYRVLRRHPGCRTIGQA
jgi:hypothetical protein